MSRRFPDLLNVADGARVACTGLTPAAELDAVLGVNHHRLAIIDFVDAMWAEGHARKACNALLIIDDGIPMTWTSCASTE